MDEEQIHGKYEDEWAEQPTGDVNSEHEEKEIQNQPRKYKRLWTMAQRGIWGSATPEQGDYGVAKRGQPCQQRERAYIPTCGIVRG